MTALVACSGGGTTITGGGDAAPEAAPEAPSVSPAAAASPYLQKCQLACKRPADGPCASADAVACIEACTTALEGAKSACAQCVVENSGWAGLVCGDDKQCTGCCKCGPDKFGPGAKEGKACVGCSAPTYPKSCDRSEERCDGFSLAKTATGTCAEACR